MTPETTQVLGTAATVYGLGGALSVLLQARQMYVRGRSCDVSARFLTVYVGGFAIWLLYSLGIGSVPIIVVHAAGLVCGTVTLTVLLWLRRPAAPATTQVTGEEQARPSRRAGRWALSEGPAARGKEALSTWTAEARPEPCG
jgi:uncharacterized protein with PQ loop repeat